MKTVRVMEVPPEDIDLYADFDHFADDDGRRWSVVTSADHEAGARCGSWHTGSWEFMRDEYATASEDYRSVCCALDTVAYYGRCGGVASEAKCRLREVARRHGVELGARTFAHLRGLAERYECAYDSEKPQIVAEILSFLARTRFEVLDIRGSCQSEFASLVIPSAEVGDKDEIEARFFNSGKGWRVEDEDGDAIGGVFTWAWSEEGERAQIYGHLCDCADLRRESLNIEICDICGYTRPEPIYIARKEA